MIKHTVAAFVLLAAGTALAGEAVVEDVKVVREHKGTYRFDVTVRHADTGWNHYADGWDVLAPDGTLLGHRTLLHPHVGEQPFTRSLDGVQVPADVKRVGVRAHDNVHGYGKTEFSVDIPAQ